MACKNLFTQAIHCFTFFTFTSVAQTTWISTCNEALVTVDGSGYRGCQNTTIEGVPCAKWGSETPHSGTLSDASNPNTGLGDHNYCRNPDGHTTIWCYTLDPNTRWADCHPLMTSDPTISPTVFPSVTPTDNTYHPTLHPSRFPTANPSVPPTNDPSSHPTTDPSRYPSTQPTVSPSSTPSTLPSVNPSIFPSTNPSQFPSLSPQYSSMDDYQTTTTRESDDGDLIGKLASTYALEFLTGLAAILVICGILICLCCICTTKRRKSIAKEAEARLEPKKEMNESWPQSEEASDVVDVQSPDVEEVPGDVPASPELRNQIANDAFGEDNTEEMLEWDAPHAETAEDLEVISDVLLADADQTMFVTAGALNGKIEEECIAHVLDEGDHHRDTIAGMVTEIEWEPEPSN
eukprot:154118_1